MADIRLDDGAKNNGLAGMMTDLIRQNISNHPGRDKVFRAMKGNVVLVAKDIDVSLTLEFSPDGMVAYDGVKPPYSLKIETDSDNILKLSTLKIKAGLPYYFDKTGREVLGMLFKRRLRINGLFAHPLLLTRLTKLFSVY